MKELKIMVYLLDLRLILSHLQVTPHYVDAWMFPQSVPVCVQ